ncbi:MULTISPECIES: TRAP transporter small permease [Halanaerobium]|jgi:TRAP-type C4-dicarboxylate transport system permease small subunit|uniref:TRAP-type C4-dicarboxylate transport system, small permease component n=1 Tax=Halanaerobium kushneri TaxID=56779 RepID=A0A1N6U260_9FIRM|nr:MULTISPECIES: TRAP transporter small permease [Halanaerobium]PUU88044.1 MAG: tripartite AtP-independent periplasmic transporter subunit DctQ [Halanaerobium sp.]RCW61921.1 TRAP-type C4-dicarboxylate transport system permease small subunit [Halanaerobium sp. ST460_2HS_T2]SIQ59728.1 TRAP-type C4-dicarboxylate transport system, small permease component [Halanaerobium kushneri]
MEEKKEKQGFLNKILDNTEKFISYIAMIFLVAMIVIVSTTVFTRYTINFTFRWSDEVALLMMIWFGFLGMALGVKNSVHLSIEFFMSLFPEKYQKYIYKIEDILVGIFGFFMLKYGWELYNATKTTVLPATQWTRGLLFIMLPLSGILIILYSAAKFFGILREEHLTIQSETEKNKKAKGEN